MTYINHIFNLTEDSGDWLADERNIVEKSGLANEDVEKGLVYTNELSERIEDGVGVGASWDLSRGLVLWDEGCGSGYDIAESCNATNYGCQDWFHQIFSHEYLHLREWTLAWNDGQIRISCKS
jgi:hypothetical protein